MADGEKVVGKFCCKATKIVIQGFEYDTNLLVVPLGDVQVILGTLWLKSLGPTLWDFSHKTLQFWKDGKVVNLQRVFQKEVNVIEEELLMKHLKTKGMAYML